MIRRHLILAAAVALAVPTTLSAAPQWGVTVQFGSRPSVNPAYEEGYARGVRAGENDARRGDRFQFNDESDYRRGDIGYRSQYGHRDGYRDVFRRGFEAGYIAGYRAADARNRPGWNGRPDGPWSNGRAYGRSDIAAQLGYNDGYAAGLDDGRDGRRFDPIGESRYRSGDHGYERSYGSRDVYRARYRDAFREGYESGFADGARYRRR